MPAGGGASSDRAALIAWNRVTADGTSLASAGGMTPPATACSQIARTVAGLAWNRLSGLAGSPARNSA